MKTDVPNSDLPGDQGKRLREEGYVGSESQIEASSARENFFLWIGVLGPAVIWFTQFQTNYTLVSWVCATHHLWVLHVVAFVFLALCVVPGVIAWSHWKSASDGGESERETAGGGRRRFMAMLGVMLSALFFLLIFAQEIPNFLIHPCVE